MIKQTYEYRCDICGGIERPDQETVGKSPPYLFPQPAPMLNMGGFDACSECWQTCMRELKDTLKKLRK